VPVGIALDGRIILLLSDLAQHSRNLELDHRVSLMLHDDQEQNWQAATRLSVLGHMQPLDCDAGSIEYQTIKDSYYRSHPESVDLDQREDFRFWQLIPLRFRMMYGFAQICWLENISPELFVLDAQDRNHIEQHLPNRGAPIRLLHACAYGVQVFEAGRVRFLNFREPVQNLAGILLNLDTGSFDDPYLNR
ncbi:MAG: hypothetical protein ACEQSD_05585, partial [Flavobacteriales bacterium]